jgi:hypothetical protein
MLSLYNVTEKPWHSRWLPSAAALVRARVKSCGICGGQSGAGVGFLRVLRFPLPIFILPFASQLPSSIIWGWHKRPVVAAVPSGLSLTPLLIIMIITFPIQLHIQAHNDSKGGCHSTRHDTIQSFGWKECGSGNAAICYHGVRSKSLWRWCVSTNIMFLDIVHCTVFI